jgi:hypothetical protein
VPDYGLVYGNPARLHGFVSPHGVKMVKTPNQPADSSAGVRLVCPTSGMEVVIPQVDYAKLTKDRSA